MIQFTKDEILHLREKKKQNPQAVLRLKDAVSEWMERPALVPATGIGDWYHYYFCPKCSVKLNFDIQQPKRHICPSCKQDWTGSPYDESWWWIVSMRNHAAAVQLAILYLIEDDERYARRAIDMMTEYARYYRSYEVHGMIPYNGPGKVGAQTLDEANFLRDFAIAYDLVEKVMSEDEKAAIAEGMLLPGAEFLMEHRHMQIHNHEVIINSAIAIIGLIFHQENYIREAVYEKYGLLYQLEHGVQDNHMWFEGAFGYHFYALTSFFTYEKFALHTKHSHIKHPLYKAMMELLFDYLEPGFRVPMLNDTNYGHTSSTYYLYEFAYRELGGEKLLYILWQLYQNEKRDNLEALIYGVDVLPPCSLEIRDNHVDMGSGNTIIRGKEGRYFLFKHDRYGGEHDHYDRLDFSYLAYGKRISPDLGTTGYGALMHYDYYKNTGSHNTINIGGENQAPVNGRLTRYEEKNGLLFMEAEADWNAPYDMPDSFTIVAWNFEYYRHVKIKRTIVWADEWFAEVTQVTGAPEGVGIDWVMHLSGEENVIPHAAYTLDSVASFSERIPYKHLHDMKQYVKRQSLDEKEPFTTVYRDGEVTTHVFGLNTSQTIFCGKGPDNPSISDINYRIERTKSSSAVFAHVVTSSDGECKLKKVSFEKTCADVVKISVTEAGGQVRNIEVTGMNE